MDRAASLRVVRTKATIQRERLRKAAEQRSRQGVQALQSGVGMAERLWPMAMRRPAAQTLVSRMDQGVVGQQDFDLGKVVQCV